MKIIVSHDVDHLYPSDHFCKDLIFPKLWIRSVLEFFLRKISFKTLCWRSYSVFEKRLHQIPELIQYDIQNNVRSIFFFGMDNVLGMSYSKDKAKKWILYVLEKGLDAGVHGVEVDDFVKMKNEYLSFQRFACLERIGIRTHYVRYNESTFEKMSKIGYYFDSSKFDKYQIGLYVPYKINEMWEFPLYIMDSYILKNGLATAKYLTKKAILDAQKMGLKYFTFLFHDYLYNEKTYPDAKKYYEWFIQYCRYKELDFISYEDAIKELNSIEI